MTKVAILGCGWLGLPLAKHLLHQGHHVNGSATSSKKTDVLQALGIHAFQIDLQQPSDHLTTFLDVDELIITMPPKPKNYVQLIEQLLPKIEQSTIKRVTYTSSISVYGNSTGIITEHTQTSPTHYRAEQIVKTENLLLNNTHFDTVILRLGGLIGPGRHPAYHVTGKELNTPNDCINLIHLDDCVSCIEHLLKTNINNAIFNLVNPYHPTKSSYYTESCKHLNLSPPISIDKAAITPKEISSEKICVALNYKFENNLILS
ncbi:MAG: NAD(P)H-binding protein [Flavobacteriaceae bacterium]